MRVTRITEYAFLVCLILCHFAPDGTAAVLRVPSEYPTIQGAVDAARQDDTIRLAAGEYAEQAVVRNKRLSIEGETGAVLNTHEGMKAMPWAPTFPILGFERSRVTLSNLVFNGNRLGEVYPDSMMGVIFRGSGGTVEQCIFRGFRAQAADLFIVSRAVNINNDPNAGTIDVTIRNCQFEDNLLSVALFGYFGAPLNAATRFVIESNSFTGMVAAQAQSYGVIISTGAQGLVRDNTISGYIFSNGEARAHGVALYDTSYAFNGGFGRVLPSTFAGNVFSNNTTHLVAYAATGSIITNNVFARRQPGEPNWGVGISGTNLVVAHNFFADADAGLALLSGEPWNGVARGRAKDVVLSFNWFTNVTAPARVSDGASLRESGTQLCCFAPSFETVKLNQSGGLRTAVRAVPGQTITFELSEDFQNWTATVTNFARVPISEIEHSFPSANRYGYLRLRGTR